MTPNEASKEVLNAAMKVHTALGPGLLEEAYKVCLKHKLQKQGTKVFSEVALPIHFEGISLDISYRIDLLVENVLIVELKSVDRLAPINKIQLLTYLRLSKKHLGLLLNFNVQTLRQGIVRVINSHSA